MNMIRPTLLALSLWSVSALVAAAQPEPIAVVDGHPVYGAQMPAGAATDIGAVLADTGKYAGTPQKFSGRVAKVCQKRGCWMVLANGEAHARVMFGKDDFFIPTDTTGTAVVYGTLSATRMSEGMAKHLAKDEGADPAKIENEVEEVQIVATSVMLTPAS